MSAHAANKKNLNIAVIKNYHSQDHCLLTLTLTLQHANAVLKKGLPDYRDVSLVAPRER